MSTRAAVYLRVSTEHQTVENQRTALQQMASARGLDVVQWYEEVESSKRHRPVYEQLKKDAQRGQFKVLLVWALDRLERSMVNAMLAVNLFDAAGVALVSHQDTWLDMTGPTRSLLVGVFGWVAEQERVRIVERSKAGQERARREGKHIGRPPANLEAVRLAVMAVSRGAAVRDAARRHGVSERTLRRRLTGPSDVAAKPPPRIPPQAPDVSPQV